MNEEQEAPTEDRGAKSFVEPTSMGEANKRMAALKIEVADIQTQLVSRGRTTADGRVLTMRELMEWRQRAKGAIGHRERERLQLREWVRQRQAELDAERGRRRDGLHLATEAAVEAVFDALKALAEHAREQDRRINELESGRRPAGDKVA